MRQRVESQLRKKYGMTFVELDRLLLVIQGLCSGGRLHRILSGWGVDIG